MQLVRVLILRRSSKLIFFLVKSVIMFTQILLITCIAFGRLYYDLQLSFVADYTKNVYALDIQPRFQNIQSYTTVK